MPAHPVAPPAAPYAADRRLLARLLSDVEADAHAHGWGQAASLLRVEAEDGRPALAARSLPRGAHPAAALLGLRAPASWRAVGVVAEGRAHRTDRSAGPATGHVDRPGPGSAGDAPPRRHGGPDGGGGRPVTTGRAAGGEPGGDAEGDGGGRPVDGGGGGGGGGGGEAPSRVRVAVLAARDGLVASVVRVDGDPPSVAVHHLAPTAAGTSSWPDDRSAGRGDVRGRATPGPPGAPTGRLVDLLLRALDLPTAPPPGSTTRLWAVLWLQAVAAVAHAAPGLPWPIVAALHPARRILSGGPPPVPGAMPEAPSPACSRARSTGDASSAVAATRPPGAMPEAPSPDGSRARSTGDRSSAVAATRPPGAAHVGAPPGPTAVGGGHVAPAAHVGASPGSTAVGGGQVAPAAHVGASPGSTAAGGGQVAPAGPTPSRPGGVARPAGPSAAPTAPAPRRGTGDDPATTGTSVASLVAAGTAAGGLVAWARLHADAAAGRWPAPGLTVADAGWLDTGAFARWVLGDLPPLGAIAEAAAANLHPSVATTVDQVLAAWGLGDGHAA